MAYVPRKAGPKSLREFFYWTYNELRLVADEFAAPSDARLKTNITEPPESGQVIEGLAVKQFDWIDSGESQRFGLIAQEVAKIYPEAVLTDSTGIHRIDFSVITPLLLSEVQGLRARVQELEEHLGSENGASAV